MTAIIAGRTEVARVDVAANSGASIEVLKGQILRVEGRSIVDLVAFDLHDLEERFDQARTKTNQGKVFISTGDVIISKSNRDMFRIVEDTFEEGDHDLQHGMCSRARWEWAFRAGIAQRQYLKDGEVNLDDFPDHGCYENLTSALAPYGVAPVDIPAPFNIFQHVEIDGASGTMRKTLVRPKETAHVDLEALMDCLVAVSACPDVAAGGREITLRLFA